MFLTIPAAKVGTLLDWLLFKEIRVCVKSSSLRMRNLMETRTDPTGDGRNSLTWGMGPTTTPAPIGKGHWEDLFTDLEGYRGHTLSCSARQEEKRGQWHLHGT